MEDNIFIGVAGNIGSGKTTLTEKLSRDLNIDAYYESVDKNPYLEDFYNNMKRWSFNLQVYFLSKRYKVHNRINENEKSAIQDRTIYEDAEIFAKNLFKSGKMTKRDWNNYKELYSILLENIEHPDLIIYLNTDVNTLLNRIRDRGRNYETEVTSSYLEELNELYKDWIEKEKKQYNVITVETNNFNIYKDEKKYTQILNRVREFFNGISYFRYSF